MKIDKQLADQIVETIKDICNHDINFIDCNGIIYASTDISRIGSFHEVGKQAVDNQTIIEVTSDDNYCGTYQGVNLPIYYQDRIIAVIGISGNPKLVKKYAYLAKQITNLLIREKELNHFNQNQTNQMNYLFDCILKQQDLQSLYFLDTLAKFNLSFTNRYRMILIKTNKLIDDQLIYQTIKMINANIYTYQYPNQYLVIIETNVFNQNEHYLKNIASNNISIIIGKETKLHQLNDSYDSITIISNNPTNYLKFDELTLEIILLSINEASKHEYLKKTISSLSADDIHILKTYFNFNQSLTNTCEQLFIHKNTLQYKLARIHRLCGYDPRKFKDANILYLAIKLL